MNLPIEPELGVMNCDHCPHKKKYSELGIFAISLRNLRWGTEDISSFCTVRAKYDGYEITDKDWITNTVDPDGQTCERWCE